MLFPRLTPYVEIRGDIHWPRHFYSNILLFQYHCSLLCLACERRVSDISVNRCIHWYSDLTELSGPGCTDKQLACPGPGQEKPYNQNENVCSFCGWLTQIIKHFHLYVSFGILHNNLTLEKMHNHSGLHFPDPQSPSVLTDTSLLYRDRILRLASLRRFFLER